MDDLLMTPPQRQGGLNQSPAVLGLRNGSLRKDEHRVLWPSNPHHDDDTMSVTSSRSTRCSGHYTALAANNMLLSPGVRVQVHPSELDPAYEYHVEWVPDEDAPKCMQCNVPFNWRRRKSHCRACGHVVCQECCTYRMWVPGLKGESKVCKGCFSKPHPTPTKTEEEEQEQVTPTQTLTAANLAEHTAKEGEKENFMSQPMYTDTPPTTTTTTTTRDTLIDKNNNSTRGNNTSSASKKAGVGGGNKYEGMSVEQYTYGQHASSYRRNVDRTRLRYGGPAFAPKETEASTTPKDQGPSAGTTKSADDMEVEGMMDEIMEQLTDDKTTTTTTTTTTGQDQHDGNQQDETSAPSIKVYSPSKKGKKSSCSRSLARRSGRGVGSHSSSSSTIVATAMLLLTSTCVAISLLHPRLWTDVQTGFKQCRKYFNKK